MSEPIGCQAMCNSKAHSCEIFLASLAAQTLLRLCLDLRGWLVLSPAAAEPSSPPTRIALLARLGSPAAQLVNNAQDLDQY